jgi:hypothetical protein
VIWLDIRSKITPAGTSGTIFSFDERGRENKKDSGLLNGRNINPGICIKGSIHRINN